MGGLGGISRGRNAGRTQGYHVGHDGFDLVRGQIFPVGRHVATALNHLPYELVFREPGADIREVRAALAARSDEACAVLENTSDAHDADAGV